ncbi:MAG: CDP-alcohol phosphatidyltransferase family protein [Gammaproteobacteria bacterium]|nr:CDP-alcohol phosphatidyltransferase family protein [Gammaproteobacteria bacterium]
MTRELQISGLLGLAVLLGMGGALAMQLDGATAARWALQSVALWALVWQQTWQRRHLNRATSAAAPYPTLGPANRLTLLRGGLIAATGGFLLFPAFAGIIGWLPALFYSVAASLDRVDGFVARRTKSTSLLGGELDTVFDALGLLIAPLLAVSYGKVHWSYLLVSVAYYLFQWGIHNRHRSKLPVYPLAPSQLRRTLAGFQMGYVAVVLWPPLLAQVTVPAGFGFMVPLLLGFTVDWLVVSGRIRPEQPETAAVFRRLTVFSVGIFQPALRAILLLALVVLLTTTTHETTTTVTYSILVALSCGAALLVLLGVAGRAGALIVLMLLAWQPATASLDPLSAVALFSAIGILLLGCGRYSLWQGDDHWVNRQDGA